MDIKNILKDLTIEEKAQLITGFSNFLTKDLPEYGIKSHQLADGPHGVRNIPEDKYTAFPNLCCIGASWDVNMIQKMGEALADDCISGGISMLLGPGINIKRHLCCGRNFEYISEDPVLSGEMAAGYINGLQSKGIGASLKHFAMNNQELYRTEISVEADMRTIMELYLKGFEIAVKKSNPASIMCSYNKLYSIWTSENKFLLTDVLREKWGYKGFVVSDWGAVHDICKAVSAGLDLEMPTNENIVEQVKKGLENGALKIEDLDRAVKNILNFVAKEPLEKKEVDRAKQHNIARELASSGIVLLKNNGILPITNEKNKKIAVVGEYAENLLVCGQGSAEVYASGKYIDSPLEELKKNLGENTEVVYHELYKTSEMPLSPPWRKKGELNKLTEDCDAVVFFVGSKMAEDTEMFDRQNPHLNNVYELFIDGVIQNGKKVVVVIQSGSAMILGDWHKKADAIVEMWLGGEGAGKAIADVLCGIINPSGKLTETFPNVMPKHLNYPGDGIKIKYSEGMDVGYRYYDKHPEEVCFPFGHGLSYTTFDYSNMKVDVLENKIYISAKITNTGDVYGGEVVQLYVSKKGGTVDCPLKELKAFKKVFLEAGTSNNITFELDIKDLAYFNTILNDWITEPCEYEFILAASSTDIRLSDIKYISANTPYTIDEHRDSMII